MNFLSIFDVIGPNMIGPSSSHTAGAVSIALMARNLFSEEIKSDITNILVKEWGYNNSIDITNPERSFAVLIEMFPDAINFKESILDYCRESVLFDIKNAINFE